MKSILSAFSETAKPPQKQKQKKEAFANSSCDKNLQYRAVMQMIEENSSVLDLGCGEGELLQYLVQEKKIKGQGIDIDQKSIIECITKGLSVFYGDLDSGLSDYGDNSFDFVILNQTIQQLLYPDAVLQEALRVGKKVIVSFPNFAHYKARFYFLLWGQAPITPSLPYHWYESPNKHFLSVRDFYTYCKERDFKVEKSVYLNEKRRCYVHPNLTAIDAVFLIYKA